MTDIDIWPPYTAAEERDLRDDDDDEREEMRRAVRWWKRWDKYVEREDQD